MIGQKVLITFLHWQLIIIAIVSFIILYCCLKVHHNEPALEALTVALAFFFFA